MSDFPVSFFEEWNLLGRIVPASYTTEQNSGRFDVAKYRRIVVIYELGVLGTNTTLDSDIEQADAASGGTLKAITGKSIAQLTQAGSDGGKAVGMEIRTEELDTNNGFHWLNVELTPATSTAIVSVLVLGGGARYEPVSTSGWDEVITQ